LRFTNLCNRHTRKLRYVSVVIKKHFQGFYNAEVKGLSVCQVLITLYFWVSWQRPLNVDAYDNRRLKDVKS